MVGVKGLSGPCIAQNSTALGPSRVVVLDVEPFPGSRLDPGFLGNFPAGGDQRVLAGRGFPCRLGGRCHTTGCHDHAPACPQTGLAGPSAVRQASASANAGTVPAGSITGRHMPLPLDTAERHAQPSGGVIVSASADVGSAAPKMRR